MGHAPYRWLAFHLGFWRVAFEPNLSKSSSHTSILSAPCAHIHWRTNAPALRATVFSGHQIFWHLACSMREGYKCSDTCRAKFVRLKMEETIILKTYQHIMYTPSTDRYTNNLDKPVVLYVFFFFLLWKSRTKKKCENLPSSANRVHTIARSQCK